MDATLNLSEISKCFADEMAARQKLEAIRWPDGPECPSCGQTSTVYRMLKMADSKKPGRPGLLRCRECKRQFTVTTGTVFEDSHIPLSKWLHALYLLCASKKGMSAHQFHRMLGITYKSAWFMAHRLRYAMTEGPMADLMTGTVEVDETYIGGKRRGTRRGRPGPDSHKTPVVALVERGTGRVRAMPMPRVTAENLKAVIDSHIEPDAMMMTDEFSAYQVLERENHQTVNHAREEYVRGDVHSNTVEGFFSLLKRGINGVYHHVGRGHLAKYCDEFSFRYEHRKVSDGTRAGKLVQGAEGKRLTYKQPSGAM